MAEASFTIRAVDATRQAFGQVQNSLSRIQTTTNAVAKSIKGAFGLGAVVMLTKQLNSTLESAEANAKQLGLTADELDNLTIATNFFDSAWEKAQRTVSIGLGSIIKLFTGANSSAKAAEIRVGRVREELEKLNRAAAESREKISAISDTPSVGFARIREQIARLNREIAQSNPSVDAVKNAERTLKIGELQVEGAKAAYDSFVNLDKALGDAAQAEDAFRFSTLSATEQQREIASALSKTESEIVSLRNAFKSAGGDMDNFDILNATPQQIYIMEQMTEKLKQYVDLQGQRKVLETEYQRLARDAADMIANGFEEAIFSGQKLSEVLRQLALDLVRLLFQRMVTQQLAAGISTMLGFPALPGRANGGSVNANSAYVVGERGAELFVPGTSGAIIPNNRMGSGGGGGGPTVNISYNIQSGVSRAELQPILEQERKRLRAEIPDMVRRGGSYRAAFA